MGYYIQTKGHHNKAEQICLDNKEASIIPQPLLFDEVASGMALICVVDNGPFEAAAYCYSEKEFEAFTEPDGRRKKWLVMDKAKAEKLSGYKK
jgi:hypothetical protein